MLFTILKREMMWSRIKYKACHWFMNFIIPERKKGKLQQQTVAIEIFKQLMLVYRRHLSIVSSSIPSKGWQIKKQLSKKEEQRHLNRKSNSVFQRIQVSNNIWTTLLLFFSCLGYIPAVALFLKLNFHPGKCKIKSKAPKRLRPV